MSPDNPVRSSRRVDVPGETAIIGFDDLALVIQTVPRLMTIRQDIAAGARAMVDRLFQRIGGAETVSMTMPASLIVRNSA